MLVVTVGKLISIKYFVLFKLINKNNIEITHNTNNKPTINYTHIGCNKSLRNKKNIISVKNVFICCVHSIVNGLNLRLLVP